MVMTIGIPKETYPGEKRVATVPEVVEKLIGLGFAVAVESGAGDGANFYDDAYAAAGAKIAPTAAELWSKADIVFKVRAPSTDEVALMKEGTTLVCFIWPAQNPELMKAARCPQGDGAGDGRRAAPVIARAEDGRADVDGRHHRLSRRHRGGKRISAASSTARSPPPARSRRPRCSSPAPASPVLRRIGTAAGLGAIVRANDTRAEVADQVKSMGGEFVKVDYEEEGSGGGGYAKVMSEGFQKAQREMYAKQATEVDIIITTALIPGKPAPKLITAEMVQSMKPGSVIVDLAAEQGGNCELTEPGRGGGASTASPSSATPICRAAWPSSPRRSTPTICCA